MKALTVKELADILQDEVKKGHGDKLVLIPETDLNAPADYRTICAVDTDEFPHTCLYLEINEDDEEAAFWDNRYKEIQTLN